MVVYLKSVKLTLFEDKSYNATFAVIIEELALYDSAPNGIKNALFISEPQTATLNKHKVVYYFI